MTFIPPDASPLMRRAFQELGDALEKLGTRDVELNGRRLHGAGVPVEPFDYATKAYVDEKIGKNGEDAEGSTTGLFSQFMKEQYTHTSIATLTLTAGGISLTTRDFSSILSNDWLMVTVIFTGTKGGARGPVNLIFTPTTIVNPWTFDYSPLADGWLVDSGDDQSVVKTYFLRVLSGPAANDRRGRLTITGTSEGADFTISTGNFKVRYALLRG